MLCFILGYGAKPLEVLTRAIAQESAEGAVLTDQNCHENINTIRKAKVIFINASELPQKVREVIRESGARVLSPGNERNVPLEVYLKARAYFVSGGEENLRNLVRFMLSLAGERRNYGEPQKLLMEGIYHPRLGTFGTPVEYLSVYDRRPLVGILFWRSMWLYGDTATVDALVEALEDEDLGVLPVFLYGKDALTGLGEEKFRVLDRFLTADGKPTVDAIISLLSFGTAELGELKRFGVPVFAPLRSFRQSVSEWQESEGVDFATQVYGAIIPEVAGAIEPIFISGTLNAEGYKRSEPFPDHVRFLARRIKRWMLLRKKPREDVKIAIVLINPPCKGLEANVAVGLGLDVPESLVRLLRKLREEGYRVGENIPSSGEELVKTILDRKAISEFRWTSVEEIVRRGGAIGFVPPEQYMAWFEELDPDLKRRTVESWGDPQRVLKGSAGKALAGMVYEGKFVIPGIRFGNVAILPQPKFGCAGPRCDGKVCRVLHDPTVVPPHQWWATYRWITRVFKADIIVHFGTHGALEFRPGKGVGLSPSCVPEATLDDIPHLYVYAASNPMEGTIAKRRSYAVLVDHLFPPMEMADVFGELEELLAQHARARSLGEDTRRREIYRQILAYAKKSHIKVSNPDDETQTVEEIHRHIELIRSSQINTGLHVFGHPPRDAKKVARYVFSIMAFDSPGFPSIVRVMAESAGLNYEAVRRERGNLLAGLRKAAEKAVYGAILGKGTSVAEEELKAIGLKLVNREKLEETLRRASEIARKIAECRSETDAFLSCLQGKFVEPGPSGALTRGKIDVLPTGKNFFAVDPRAIPTKPAWKIGVETAKKLLEAYRKKHGRWPETVGQVLWSIDAYKADGEQLSAILYLIGARPIWKGDRVTGVELLPLEELGRPRIDVVVRISEIVRDTLPNYIYLIDEAVEKAVVVEEPLDTNFVKKHYVEHVTKLATTGRKNPERVAKFRVFCAPPGAYGAGVNFAVEASAWESLEDLAKVWLQWGGYAYGKDAFGVCAMDALALNLKSVDVVARNHISDEHDITNCCSYFAFHGGFKAAADAIRGRETDILIVDTRDISDTRVLEVEEEIERVFRAKLLNDRWIEGIRKHGYVGASEFAKKILHLYGWQATSGVVKDWMFEEIAKRYVLDEEMRRWFEEHNPYAAEEIARRLIEAYERGIWKAKEELIEAVREAYSEMEGILEEDMGGNVQGGTIDIHTFKDDAKWSERMKEVERAWTLVKGE